MIDEILSTKNIIAKKRDGKRISGKEIDYIVKGLFNNNTNIEQLASLCMAIYFNGMTKQETANLTSSMAYSGQILSIASDKEVVDKHSTGGVGDKVSLILAPLLAEFDFMVPMISGRSLGHTGGTLDKLESIAGYNTQPSLDKLKDIMLKIGVAIIGQTPDLAPADKIIYKTRDICSSVESMPLITASILSKKKAAGVQNLVMDLKVGNGAFVDDITFIKNLANSLINTGKLLDMKVLACFSDMNQVLGFNAGNALEVIEICDWLKEDKKEPRLKKLVYHLAIKLISNSRQYSGLTTTEIEYMIDSKFSTGAVAQGFEKMVALLGGPNSLLSSYKKDIKICSNQIAITAKNNGYLSKINTKLIGQLINNMGGGRNNKDDIINHQVGFSNFLPLNSKVTKGQELFIMHCDDENISQNLQMLAQNAYIIKDRKNLDSNIIHNIKLN